MLLPGDCRESEIQAATSGLGSWSRLASLCLMLSSELQQAVVIFCQIEVFKMVSELG